MKSKKYFINLIFLLSIKGYGQQYLCADSSYRIKYIFDNVGAILYNNPDTIGNNIFTGNFLIANNKNGIAIAKTTWGDSILWARKIHENNGINITALNSLTTPDGSIIFAGAYNTFAASELLIGKFSANGIIQWLKRFRSNQNNTGYGNGIVKNFSIGQNGIYFIGAPSNGLSTVAKIDFSGNIVWSKAFGTTAFASTSFVGNPIYYNDAVFILGLAIPSLNSLQSNQTVTKLDDLDGSVLESIELKIMPEPIIKGVFPSFLNHNQNNTFTLTGYAQIDAGGGAIINSNFRTNTKLNSNLNLLENNYYSENIPLDNIYSYNFDFNKNNQYAILASNLFKLDEKYFVLIDKNNNVKRTRKFLIPSVQSAINSNSINLDDKENIHFLFHYPQNNKLVTEYARISNFAPDGTLGCFGKDTSILTRFPFTLTKEPFVWDNIQSNVIVASDVPYTEDTAFVTKEVVCKIVSLCDSVHIQGPPKGCVGSPLRYTASKNVGCFKNLDWAIDTSFANIINVEGDSAITISFKKAFSGYLHAALTDCVVKDSLRITAVAPKTPSLLNRSDSLLCPGKTLTLTANNGFTNYQWQGNTAGQQFTINAAGQYKVTALDSCNNLVADSVTVTVSDTSLTLATPAPICQLDSAFISFPADITSIIWQPNTNSLLRNKTIVAYPAATTLYTITAERQPNCPITRTALVTIKNCPQNFYMPNSFTPNKDGKNDLFKPIITGVTQLYNLIIYNRYGQKVFETNNSAAGWDGSFADKVQPMGGYVYVCNYRFAGKQQQMVKGYFVLVR